MTIYICGDSTAASYGPELAPLTGWGQVLGELLTGVTVENRAIAGRSTKSFLYEGRLQAIEAELRPGDALLIQFTHNDFNPLVWRCAEPWGPFVNNLSIFVDTARQAGATPVLMTPICRRVWEKGELLDSLEPYPDAVRTLAARKNAALIDMYAQSFELVRRLGEEESRGLYMHLEAGKWPHWPDGQTDDTHTQRRGAEAFARLAAEGLRALGLAGEEKRA